MVGSNWPLTGNAILRIQWSRDRWRHVTPKGQGREADIFDAQYLNNRTSYMVGSYWLPIGNDTLGIHWSHDRWRHEAQKVKVVTTILLKLNISKTVLDGRSVQIDHLWETPYCESNRPTWEVLPDVLPDEASPGGWLGLWSQENG